MVAHRLAKAEVLVRVQGKGCHQGVGKFGIPPSSGLGERRFKSDHPDFAFTGRSSVWESAALGAQRFAGSNPVVPTSHIPVAQRNRAQPCEG